MPTFVRQYYFSFSFYLTQREKRVREKEKRQYKRWRIGIYPTLLICICTSFIWFAYCLLTFRTLLHLQNIYRVSSNNNSIQNTREPYYTYRIYTGCLVIIIVFSPIAFIITINDNINVWSLDGLNVTFKWPLFFNFIWSLFDFCDLQVPFT